VSKEQPKSGEKPNVDEAVQFYMKKWNVSEEEALEKISQLVEERKAPTMENLFPEPLGPLSMKVQDMNQAVLSTAITRKKLDDLQNPPGETSGVEKSIDDAVQDAGKNIITEKLTGKDPIREKVDDVLGNLVADALSEKLSGGSTEKIKVMLDGILDEFGEKMILPLVKKLEKLEGEGAGPGLTGEKAVEIVMDAQDKYKKFLESRGFKVESVNVTKDEVEKMLKDTVATEKEKWEQESGAQVEIETQRIQATEQILTTVADRVMDIFLVPIKGKIEEAIEKGAFSKPPAA